MLFRDFNLDSSELLFSMFLTTTNGVFAVSIMDYLLDNRMDFLILRYGL